MGAAGHPNDLLNKHVSTPAPAVDQFNRHATTGGSAFVRTLLAKKPADRPGSMREVLQQLRTVRLLERAGA